MAVLGENMDYDNQHFRTFNLRFGDVLLPKIDFQEPLKIEIEHFIDCIKNGTQCITGIDHAKKVVKILSSEDQLTFDHDHKSVAIATSFPPN